MTTQARIYNVSQSQFSIARSYGGLTSQGVFYHYDPAFDILVRDDVWKKEAKENKQHTKEIREAEKAKWLNIQQLLF